LYLGSSIGLRTTARPLLNRRRPKKTLAIAVPNTGSKNCIF
jgi:hypothetical protein